MFGSGAPTHKWNPMPDLFLNTMHDPGFIHHFYQVECITPAYHNAFSLFNSLMRVSRMMY